MSQTVEDKIKFLKDYLQSTHNWYGTVSFDKEVYELPAGAPDPYCEGGDSWWTLKFAFKSTIECMNLQDLGDLFNSFRNKPREFGFKEAQAPWFHFATKTLTIRFKEAW